LYRPAPGSDPRDASCGSGQSMARNAVCVARHRPVFKQLKNKGL